MKYQELMKVIRGGAFKPVYLFTGPETHIARMMENNLIKQVIPAGLEQINVMTFEEKDTAVEDVTGICRQLPMMSPYRVVILREETGMLHSSDKTVMDELGDYIAHPELTTVLILWDVKADKRKKWYKALKKTGDIVEYDKLREEDLGKWIGRRLQLAGKKTTQRVVNQFVERSRYLLSETANMAMVDNELNKLVDYTAGRETITLEDLAATMPVSVDDNIFRMVDHAVRGQMGEALKMLQNFYLEGESPFGVFGLIAGQIRTMTMVRILTDRGESAASIAGKVGRPGFVVKKMAANRKFTEAKLRRLMIDLGDLDYKMKVGAIEPEMGVELFMLTMA